MINSQSIVESLLFSIQSGTTGWDKISVCSVVSSCTLQSSSLWLFVDEKWYNWGSEITSYVKKNGGQTFCLILKLNVLCFLKSTWYTHSSVYPLLHPAGASILWLQSQQHDDLVPHQSFSQMSEFKCLFIVCRHQVIQNINTSLCRLSRFTMSVIVLVVSDFSIWSHSCL